jgi:molybdopterin molybdotransferase
VIHFEEARERLLLGVRALGAERVAVDHASGRVLAEDIVAGCDMPEFDHSSMDGYAFAAADFAGEGPWELVVAGESAAGGRLPELAPGTACRIFTGARLPVGCDTVVPQEEVELLAGTARVRLPRAPAAGQWLRKRAADLARGAVAIARGTRLSPGHAALAAALDRPALFVARRPLVTVLCSGDELRAPGERWTFEPRGSGRAPAAAGEADGSIAESNGTFVAAAGRAAGAIVRIAPYVRDDLDAAERAVREALVGSDLIVTIGGVSVGDRDVMKSALEKAGVVLDFWRVAIKPGKPLCVGRAGATLALGLPGNPASASLTFLLFGVPLLRAMQGDRETLPVRWRMPVAGSVRRSPGRMEFLRARIAPVGGVPHAVILPNQASGAVTSFAEADTLVIVPPEKERVDSGETLDVIRISDV